MAIDVNKLRRAFELACEAAPGCSVHLGIHTDEQDLLNEAAPSGRLETCQQDVYEFDHVEFGDHPQRSLTVFGPQRPMAKGAA